MFVRDYRELPVESSGVDGLSVRWAITASQGAANFAMRIFELVPDKASPIHQHESEHEIFILSGQGEIETEDEIISISEGSVVFIQPNESHQFRNTGREPLRFVDTVMFSVFTKN